MLVSRILQAFALTIFAGLAGMPAHADVLQLAQGASCSSFQTMCSNRCRQRAPQDANCVADHCTPKLMACRQNGCWQEGRLYGGKKTCGLARS